MTALEFQALERWVFAAADVILTQEMFRGETVLRSQDNYNQRREEARAILVQPKETDQ